MEGPIRDYTAVFFEYTALDIGRAKVVLTCQARHEKIGAKVNVNSKNYF